MAKATAPKIELPSDGADYVPPASATVEDLAALEEAARLAADALLGDNADPKVPTATRIAQANQYIAAMDKIKERSTALVAEQEAEAATIADLRSRITPAADPAAEGEAEDIDPETGKPRVKPANAGGDPANPAAPASTDAGLPDPVLVAAMVAATDELATRRERRSAIRGAAQFAPAPQPRSIAAGSSKASLTAGAGVAGFDIGEAIDWEQAGQAAFNQFKRLPSGRGGSSASLSIGRVHLPATDERLVASGGTGEVDISAQLAWAVDHARLLAETGEQSLVAAGGWCAPSEVLYDLINLISNDGMVDLPGITVNRGGVKFSLGPDFSAIYSDGAAFTKTETQAIAGSAKPIVNIPCPAWTDNRMVVDGMYLTGDILSQKGYPEGYADFIQKSLSAWAHYVNQASIADMETATGSLVDLTGDSGPHINLSVSTELLGAMELIATDMRYRNRLSINNALEVVLPLWAKGVIRSDLAKQAGVNNLAISDGQIAEYFTVRGIRPQYVYDWQDFFATGSGFGNSSAAAAWPMTVKFMIFPEGTFARALSDVIELNAIYDSALLATNQFVALFIEQARLTIKRAWDARTIKVPVNVSGTRALGVDYSVSGRQPTV